MVRFKNRYLLVGIQWKDGRYDESVTDTSLVQCLRESVQLNFGDVGLATAVTALQVKYLNPVTSLFILRCSRDQLRDILCALTVTTTLAQQSVVFRVLHVAGKLASSKEVTEKHNSARLQGRLLSPRQLEITERLSEQLRKLDL